MTRKSNSLNAVFTAAGKKQLELLKIQLGTASFKVVEIIQKISDIVENELKAPPRASVENVIQLAYICKLANGYDVYVLTGTIDGEFTSTGHSWVHIRDEKGELVVSWRFSKNNMADLLKRLTAYALYAKEIAKTRHGDASLVQISLFEYKWVTKTGDTASVVDFSKILLKLSLEDRKIVFLGEKRRTNYLSRTEGTRVRRFRDINSTWKE